MAGRGKCISGRAGSSNGLTPLSEIAQELGVNIKTVRADLENALNKLRVSPEIPEFWRLVQIRSVAPNASFR